MKLTDSITDSLFTNPLLRWRDPSDSIYVYKPEIDKLPKALQKEAKELAGHTILVREGLFPTIAKRSIAEVGLLVGAILNLVEAVIRSVVALFATITLISPQGRKDYVATFLQPIGHNLFQSALETAGLIANPCTPYISTRIPYPKEIEVASLEEFKTLTITNIP